MTSSTTALIRNGFVFVPASSFSRDDFGDETLSPHEIPDAFGTPNKMPALTPEQQQMLRMAYDANVTPEARGGIDGIYLDIKTAVQWGLIPPEPLPGDNLNYAPQHHIPANHIPQTTINPEAAGMKPAPKKKVPRYLRPHRPWDRNIKPRLVPPGYE